MSTVFVARSTALSKWAADVGLTKHVYLLGVAEDRAEAALAALNEATTAGVADWKLAARATAEAEDPDAARERVARKEREVDPALYPRLRGLRGLFKVKPGNVENHILVQRALAGEEMSTVKVGHKEVATYLLDVASG